LRSWFGEAIMKNNINVTENFKQSKNVPLTIKAIIIFLLLIPLSVNAEYNSFKLGEAAGSYIFSIYLIHAFKNSQCSYVSIKKIPINPVINDIKQTFIEEDRVPGKAKIESRLEGRLKKISLNS